MKLKNSSAELFIPDNKPVEEAIQRTTHMAISAHQDDIEIMAHHGALECFGRDDKWFFGVVVTNGAGSPRDDLYASYTDEEMQKVRKLEQKKAAFVGEYGAQALLDYSSSAVKDPNGRDVIEEIKELVTMAKPKIIYTHNLADKHDTHIGVVTKVIKALRELPESDRPEKLYGCEVWRNLDWVNDDEKVVFDVSAHPNIAAALVEVFDSQICGGKRYDLATVGRRLANATYAASHGTDNASSLIYGMDLTPLIKDVNLDIVEYVQGYISRFAQDVTNKLKKTL
ncbi:MAG: PIG-L family deacetylase [Clostridia bacterium]|nr:PIG-L family deacetylase [Clostridia bacterium]